MGPEIRDIGSRPRNEVARESLNGRGGDPAAVERATDSCDDPSSDSLSGGVSVKLTRAPEGDEKIDGKFLDDIGFKHFTASV